jgi:radical SAM protein with 4Fe4S-binding SPASM domain
MAGLFVKYMNSFTTGSSWAASSLTGNPMLRGMPTVLSLELTNHCNLRCPECATGSGMLKRGKGYMDIALYNRVISEMKPYLFYLNLYFQGEPMAHPDFFRFTEQVGGITKVVSTNGHFLSVGNAEKLAGSGIGKMIVSLDGMDNKTYSLYRRDGDYEKVLLGIRNLAEAIKITRSSLILEIQFLVNRYNEDQIEKAHEFAREVNARLKLKSMQLISGEDAYDWMPANKLYRRYTMGEGSIRVKSKLPDRCFRLWMNPVITWDGKVIPCCFDKDAEFVMGDLNTESFRTIWNEERYKDFRRRLLNDRKSIAICSNCTSGLRGVKF